jgi:hypothetical protein
LCHGKSGNLGFHYFVYILYKDVMYIVISHISMPMYVCPIEIVVV